MVISVIYIFHHNFMLFFTLGIILGFIFIDIALLNMVFLLHFSKLVISHLYGLLYTHIRIFPVWFHLSKTYGVTCINSSDSMPLTFFTLMKRFFMFFFFLNSTKTFECLLNTRLCPRFLDYISERERTLSFWNFTRERERRSTISIINKEAT